MINESKIYEALQNEMIRTMGVASPVGEDIALTLVEENSVNPFSYVLINDEVYTGYQSRQYQLDLIEQITEDDDLKKLCKQIFERYEDGVQPVVGLFCLDPHNLNRETLFVYSGMFLRTDADQLFFIGKRLPEDHRHNSLTFWLDYNKFNFKLKDTDFEFIGLANERDVLNIWKGHSLSNVDQEAITYEPSHYDEETFSFVSNVKLGEEIIGTIDRPIDGFLNDAV